MNLLKLAEKQFFEIHSFIALRLLETDKKNTGLGANVEYCWTCYI